ncbi:GFA family protein [Stappia sp. BW2]|uniref:GFA family protein n=1 Tax=Stappia sp. BW2 TaxID=2592622 RepID=UPI0011DEC371|nr:GFA family protein [Stappia sp. BW2]TYC68277.1 GFA family protein [Stappia sp. BW2]
MITGKCECGKVEFEVEAAQETLTVCHCSQCRRISGHTWACTHAPIDKLRFSNKDGLGWYESSSFARRGFCKFCGSSLFYQRNGQENIAIAAGSLNGPTGLKVGKHILVKDKGDYYEIHENEPQIACF